MTPTLRSQRTLTFPSWVLEQKSLVLVSREAIKYWRVVCVNDACKIHPRFRTAGFVGSGDDATVYIDDCDYNTVLRCAKTESLSFFKGVAAHIVLNSVSLQAEFARTAKLLGIDKQALRILGYPIVPCQEPVCVHKDNDIRAGCLDRRGVISLGDWLSIVQEKGEAELGVILWQVALYLLLLGQAFGFRHGDLHPWNILLEEPLEHDQELTWGSQRFLIPKGSWKVRFVDLDTARFRQRDGSVTDLRPESTFPDFLYLCSSLVRFKHFGSFTSLRWMTMNLKKRRYEAFASKAALRRLGLFVKG